MATAWADVGDLPPAHEPRIPDERMTADVCVVGMGASGLTAARQLAERGADCLAIDAAGVGAGAAGANGGFLLAGPARFHHRALRELGRKAAVALYRATLDELDRVVDEEPSVRRVGSVRVAASDRELADIGEQLNALRADGFRADAWDGPEGRGLLVPDDGVYQPMARCRRLAIAAARAGARLTAPVRAMEIHSLAGRVRVVADAAAIEARRVIVAVDGGLEVLLPELAGEVTTRRLQMLATAPDVGVVLSRPVYRRWGLDWYQQLPTGEVLLGGGRDIDENDVGPAEPTAATSLDGGDLIGPW
jgi:glycine/D-amino acid oxidase-like deaminating enzyme